MTYRSVVTILTLVGLTKKRFGHYAVSKILSLRSPGKFKAVVDESLDLKGAVCRKSNYVNQTQAKATITRCDLSPDSFVFTPGHCANFYAMRYK